MTTRNFDQIGSVWRVLNGLLESAKPQYWLKPLTAMLVASTYALGDFPNVSRLLYGFLIVGPLLWGGLYILNDITDKNDDSQHPVKRFRPFPAGVLDAQVGLLVSSLMIGVAILLGLQFGSLFTACLILMCVKQLAYTIPNVRLKEKFLWDVVSGSLGNASLRFSAGWFLFTNNLEMPILLLILAECMQLAGFFVNRLYANYGSGVERQLQYTSTTTSMSVGHLKIIIKIFGGAGIVSFILLVLNDRYQILPHAFGTLPLQSLAVFIIFLFCLPLLAKIIRFAEQFTAREARLYYDIPLLISFAASILLSFIVKYYG